MLEIHGETVTEIYARRSSKMNKEKYLSEIYTNELMDMSFQVFSSSFITQLS